MRRAVLFDFDYTLADSSEGIIYCFEQVAEVKGLAKPNKDEIRRTIGMPLTDMFTVIFKISHEQVNELDLCGEYMFIANQVAAELTEIYPDAERATLKLKRDGYLLGIVSTKNRSRIMETLKLSKVNLNLDLIIGGDDVTTHKPSPEGIYKAKDLLKLDIEEIVFVGDSIYDYQAAWNASCQFLAVTTGTTTCEDFIRYGQNDRLIFENLTQIADYLCKTK